MVAPKTTPAANEKRRNAVSGDSERPVTPDFHMSEDQLTRLMASMRGASLPAPREKADERFIRSSDWETLKEFPGRNDYLDEWFVSFEGLMAANRIPMSAWTSRLFECPKLSQPYKKFNQGESYQDIRLNFLKKYGSKLPVQFFRYKLHHVKGEDRDSVNDQFVKLLELHNRASRDENKPLLAEEDLLYALCQAFEGDNQDVMLRNLSMATKDENPFQYLLETAPCERPITGNVNKITSNPQKPHGT